MSNKNLSEIRKYSGGEVRVLLRKAVPPEATKGRFPPLMPGTSVVDGIVIERDVAIKLRDGVTIYADIYRPDGQTAIPAIVAWSPYGKRVGYAISEGVPSIPGVPLGTLSAGTKTEGPDPYFWVRQGYAVVNPDARGAGQSEGVIQYWSRQEARDSADVIDWIGVQEWCNERVGMAGNSWLAISQWAAAAERPKHLACIAPWEGSTDVYRQIFVRGGIPDVGFSGGFAAFLSGQGLAEDLAANIKQNPLHNSYWDEKLADLEQIEIPAYICAGWHHFHLPGSIEGFNRIKSKKKWLRIHREFEWPDQYTPENLADLKLFFDRYLKGHYNGWELTPPVRLDVMDRGDREHVTRRPELSFPLPDTEYRKFYLDANTTTLKDSPLSSETSFTYDASKGLATFDYTFEGDTELTGYSKLHLWVEAEGADEIDLFIVIQKADAEGNFVPTLIMGEPHAGAEAMLRVSQRKLDPVKSTDIIPVQSHLQEEPLKQREIVPIDIAIWPSSRLWHAGEKLRVVVSGHYVRDKEWFEPFSWDLRNKGQHIIHTGGRYDSYLQVPVIPEVRSVVPGKSITSDQLTHFLGGE